MVLKIRFNKIALINNIDYMSIEERWQFSINVFSSAGRLRGGSPSKGVPAELWHMR